MTKIAAPFLAITLAFSLHAAARMGDSYAQTLVRYGQPVASSGTPGELTSTRTFSISGLEVTCGYVAGKVEMETVTRSDRDFVPAEIEAFIRTNGQKKNWTPSGPFTDGTFKRADGITATVDGNKITFQSPKWIDSLAQDAATDAKIAAGDTNAIPAVPAHPDVDIPASSTPPQLSTHRPTPADINTTNAP